MALNVSQFQSSDNFNMAEFNDMISQINTGVNSEITALTNLINSGAKIQTGSYVGTGTYGASNPCSLTFDFVPILVFITSNYQLAVGVYTGEFFSPLTIGGYDSNKSSVTWVGNTMSWYYRNSYGWQFNASGTTYYYYAFG